MSVVGGCWRPWSGRLVLSGVVFRAVFPLLVPFLAPWRRATTQEPIFQPGIPRQWYRSMVCCGRGLGFWLDGCFPLVPIVARTSFFYLFVHSLLFAMMFTFLVTGCVSASTFYVITAILTMINRTWVANLANFQRRWRLAHACCFVYQLTWSARRKLCRASELP